ncbi:hypothetical protein F7644_07810 [Tenacibaculum finnmarkense genomovar ulcerans]|uniref:hypothetical protein n=1 Tax=Tenacibaculum finnmarkense TaxID=2781243 RepID=UPI00187BB921|nr:hypothetical protein [Tenacibaculum finnmarkense]MBE7645897.1 hypothetical protein [Tenacibaculum finnmarkense genomovar ulcerans]
MDELLFNSISEELAKEQASKMISSIKEWNWLGYLILPIIILLRSILVALCISISMIFYEDIQFKFKNFLKITLLGELIFLLVIFSKILYFSITDAKYSLEKVKQFHPLSYTNFLNLETIEPWLIYPLQTVNLFEIGYFFVLVYGLHKLLKNKYSKSFEIVAVSYGLGLVIWLGLVMFLTLNLT